ncbi:caspase family protein [Chthonobacter rhizosphaerae]|uniref:caspase family protein n=1 Tax=Chthonobacter rhizosphaerae TaxID=2735553 RepID=UPI001FE519CA|nr:caspase family protein [Chthonobacter rhizosphaerae]
MRMVPRLLLAAGLALAPGAARAVDRLVAPEGGEVRAVVVGVDLYRNVPPLKGAVADAEDLSLTLRKVGVTDVSVLLDGAADRDGILAAIEAVTARARPGDLVVLAVAGHGSSEPERVKGSKPGGRDEVYLLAGFDTRLPGSRQRIFGDEFKALIRAVEAKGASVLFVADTCHAGGLTRRFDPRMAGGTWRQAPAYVIEEDDLAPISTPAEAVASDFDFERLTFLAAVDEKSKVAEVRIPGIPRVRGALSYAVARAIEGAADRDADRRVSRRELFEYVRQSVYQFTDQRQNVVTRSAGGGSLESAIQFAFSQTAESLPAGAEPLAGSGPAVSITPGNPVLAKDAAASGAATKAETSAPATAQPIRIAALGGSARLQDLRPALTAFVAADPAEADIIYDPARREALAHGDVVATGVALDDLPFVIDRTAAVNALKHLSGDRPQTVRTLPSDTVHVSGETVGVELDDVADRHLILFNIAGDGTVQSLHPGPDDVDPSSEATFSVRFRVVAPFGADTMVAVSAAEPMPDLVAYLVDVDGRRAAGYLPARLPALLPPDARVGFTALYTAPVPPGSPPPDPSLPDPSSSAPSPGP